MLPALPGHRALALGVTLACIAVVLASDAAAPAADSAAPAVPQSYAKATWPKRDCACVYVRGANTTVKAVDLETNCAEVCPLSRKDRDLCAVSAAPPRQQTQPPAQPRPPYPLLLPSLLLC